MKTKSAIYLIGLGIAGTLLYQNIKNGNLRKWTREMNKAASELDFERAMELRDLLFELQSE